MNFAFRAKQKTVAAIWMIVGIALVIWSIIGYERWHSYGGLFATNALAVWGFSSGGGMLAAISGLFMYFLWPGYRLWALIVVASFALYAVAYLVFGGEGSFFARLFLPVCALLFCYTTYLVAR